MEPRCFAVVRVVTCSPKLQQYSLNRREASQDPRPTKWTRSCLLPALCCSKRGEQLRDHALSQS
eukprot:8712596-Heterocapsa_arctica.AAC.1